ncbi:hypothetical protein FA95DRAFT_1678575 [Auriscalpium vulgare]|uniref:Uncharacterized protein n=1 Tax=Auriscalpium vulgare TaxID=40419 RepID=A0ACB8RW05_9AGAM|nr:hypothetical protein FA95DRAFT_1678575 [Auriscalpium vulgare]
MSTRRPVDSRYVARSNIMGTGSPGENRSATMISPRGAAQWHNTGLPVSRLPPEFLSIVFAILTLIYIPAPTSKSLTWMYITHVCRRWRDVALNNPALWSTIILPFPLGARWAEAFLSRSKSSALTITKDREGLQPLPLRQSELALVQANLARTRSLCISAESAISALSHPAPILRTLDIDMCGEWSLMDSLLGGAPALQHLRVTGELPWTSPLLRVAHLVSLEIVSPGRYPFYATLAEVIAALRSMRHTLERFVVRFEVYDAEGPRSSIVQMAVLRHLELTGNMETASQLFSHVSLPEDARIRYHVGLITEGCEANTSLHLAVACRDPGAAPLTHVKIRFPSAYKTEIDAWRNGAAEGAPALAASYDFERNRYDPQIATGQAVEVFSKDMEHLTVRSNSRNWPWLFSLHDAHSLRHIEVVGGAAHPLLHALLRCIDGFLPSLSTLILAGEEPTMDVTAADVSVSLSEYRTLPQCLAERARAGCALKELDIVGCCDVDQEIVGRLQKAMPEMILRW